MADISSELIKKIRRIQYQTTKLANDVLAGAYLSAFKGKGMEFEDVREYQNGDDIRSIDWNVTARMNYPYVKSFREERELTVTLVVDVSFSTRFGSSHQLKSDLITEVAAVLAFSAIKNNDKVSLILFSDTVEKYLPPKKGTRHVLQVIRELLAHSPQQKGAIGLISFTDALKKVARASPPWLVDEIKPIAQKGTNLKAALSFLGKVQPRRSICFLISDFICPDCSHETALIAARHDLISIAVADPTESVFPQMDLVTFADLETGEMQLIDTSSPATQQFLKEKAEQRLADHKKLMQSVGADLVLLYTNQPYLPMLKKFFKIRQKRRR